MDSRVERLIAVSPTRVMQALTSPDELRRWCCQGAEVTTDVYRLTGSTLPSTVMGGRILASEDKLLRFEWVLNGHLSVVEVMINGAPQEEMPPATFAHVVVAHTQIPDGVLQANWPQLSWECVWELWLRHLAGWVERAEAPGPFDYTAPLPRTVERSLVMAAPPDRIWRAITDPQVRSRWLEVPMGKELSRQEVQQVVYSFELPDQPATTVTWTLTPVKDDRVGVTIREDGLTWDGVDHHLGWHLFLVSLHQETAPPLVRQSIWIKASPTVIWRFMSTEEVMRRWFHSTMRFEPRLGGQVSFDAHGGKLAGTVTAIDPGQMLVFTWTELGVGWPEPAPLLLTVTLTPEGNGTRVTMTHSGFENLPDLIRSREYGGYQRGWSLGKGMKPLKELAEAEVGA